MASSGTRRPAVAARPRRGSMVGGGDPSAPLLARLCGALSEVDVCEVCAALDHAEAEGTQRETGRVAGELQHERGAARAAAATSGCPSTEHAEAIRSDGMTHANQVAAVDVPVEPREVTLDRAARTKDASAPAGAKEGARKVGMRQKGEFAAVPDIAACLATARTAHGRPRRR